jgi:hypothetical protein
MSFLKAFINNHSSVFFVYLANDGRGSLDVDEQDSIILCFTLLNKFADELVNCFFHILHKLENVASKS